MADKKTKNGNGNEEKRRPKLTLARSEDYGVIYSDAVRMSVSQYDFKLTFSINETLPNNDVQITEMVTVALTPQHAKVLADALTRNIESYEKNIMSLDIKEGFDEFHEKKLREQNIID